MAEIIINIPWSGWQIVRELGEGGYGKVYENARGKYICEIEIFELVNRNLNDPQGHFFYKNKTAYSALYNVSSIRDCFITQE